MMIMLELNDKPGGLRPVERRDLLGLEVAMHAYEPSGTRGVNKNHDEGAELEKQR